MPQYMPNQPTPLPSSRPFQLAMWAALGQTVLVVGGTFIARWLIKYIPPITIAALRLGISSLLIAIIIGAIEFQRRREKRQLFQFNMPPFRDLWKIVLLGVLGTGVNQTAFIVGLAYSTPARCSLLYALSPLFVLLIAILAKHEKLHAKRLVGMVVAFAGVALILSERGGLAGASLYGDFIMMIGVVAWAAYTALGRPYLQRYGTFTVTAIALMSGSAIAMPLLAPYAFAAPLNNVPLSAWASVGFLCVFSSLVAYSLWYFAIRLLPAPRIAVFMNLQPPMVVVISWGFFGEAISARFIVGAIATLGGVALTQKKS